MGRAGVTAERLREERFLPREAPELPEDTKIHIQQLLCEGHGFPTRDNTVANGHEKAQAPGLGR